MPIASFSLTSLQGSSLSLRQKVELLERSHPNWFLRTMARLKKNDFLAEQKRVWFNLPWDCFDHWTSIFNLFESKTPYKTESVLFQHSCLLIWMISIRTIVPIESYSIVFSLLLASLMLFSATHFLNVYDSLSLATVSIWSYRKPHCYVWKNHNALPAAIPPKWERLWLKLYSLHDRCEDLTLQQFLWQIKTDIFFRKLQRQKITYLIVLLTFLSCLCKIGQEFLEHLYSQQVHTLGF